MSSSMDILPTEVHYSIFQHVNESERNALVNSYRLNKYYSKVADRMLFSRYEYNCIEDPAKEYYNQFLEAMVSNQKAPTYLENLILGTDWSEGGAKYPKGFLDYVMRTASHLRHLKVAYREGFNFLDIIPPKLETLVVRPKGLPGFRWNKERTEAVEYNGILDLHFLEAALKSQSLKKLDIGAQYTGNEMFILEAVLPKASSTIEELVLKTGCFHDEALVKILQTIKTLKSFEFVPITYREITYEREDKYTQPVAENALLPAVSAVRTGLQQHTNTLETLTIRPGDSEWTPQLDKIGSLTNFTALKNLEIQATTLLGWNHCAHILSEGIQQSVSLPPSSLAKLLPSSLESLTLGFDHHHSARNGTTYVLEIINGLIEESSSPTGGLPNLSEVTIDFDRIHNYCNDCNGDLSIAADPLARCKANCISIQEATSIVLAVHKQRKFDYCFISPGHYLDEEDPAHLLRGNSLLNLGDHRNGEVERPGEWFGNGEEVEKGFEALKIQW